MDDHVRRLFDIICSSPTVDNIKQIETLLPDDPPAPLACGTEDDVRRASMLSASFERRAPQPKGLERERPRLFDA